MHGRRPASGRSPRGTGTAWSRRPTAPPPPPLPACKHCKPLGSVDVTHSTLPPPAPQQCNASLAELRSKLSAVESKLAAAEASSSSCAAEAGSLKEKLQKVSWPVVLVGG